MLTLRDLQWNSAVRQYWTVLIAASTCACLLWSLCPAAFGQTPDEKLATARATYDTGLVGARAAVVAQYQEVITQLSEKDATEAQRVQDELQYFERDKVMIPRADMAKAFMTFGETSKALGDALAAAYRDAAAAHVKGGQLDRANALRRELAALSLPTKLVSLQLARTKLLAQHGGYKLMVQTAPNIGEKMNATFEIVNGLAESSFASIRSFNCQDHYFCVDGVNKQVLLSKLQDSDDFRRKATFSKVTGVGGPNAMAFESIKHPGFFICVKNGQLVLIKSDGTLRFKQACSFLPAEPAFKAW